MSVSDELTSVQRCLEDLVRLVGRLEKQMGGSLEIRRVRHDADHLRESIALLRDTTQGHTAQGHTAPKRPELVTISDDPYDQSLWSDSDDEGLGASHRHAP